MSWLNKIRRGIATRGRLAVTLKVISSVCAAAVAVGFIYVLLVLLVFEEYTVFLKVALAAAVGYAAVTLVRKLIDAPRPYELLDFYTVPPKKKKGHSFPSRHVFSAFCIATITYSLATPISVATLILGIVIAVLRVLLGIHFVRDVVCGALIGIATGIIGYLTVAYI